MLVQYISFVYKCNTYIGFFGKEGDQEILAAQVLPENSVMFVHTDNYCDESYFSLLLSICKARSIKLIRLANIRFENFWLKNVSLIKDKSVYLNLDVFAISSDIPDYKNFLSLLGRQFKSNNIETIVRLISYKNCNSVESNSNQVFYSFYGDRNFKSTIPVKSVKRYGQKYGRVPYYITAYCS